MKRYENSRCNRDKYNAKQRKREHDGGGFRCSHCKQFVVINDMLMGTANRNHCNWCLWSKHVDIDKGDRRSDCHGGMKPIGLTFKHEGHGRRGEVMIIHLCSSCSKVSINRIARDDPEFKVQEIFTGSFELDADSKQLLANNGIYLMSSGDSDELSMQLFGRS
jgi:hypothetical protein